MRLPENLARAMPDVAADAPSAAGVLDWVGMGGIQMPVRMAGAGDDAVACAARVTAYVNLARPDARGIHMSRLYRHVDHALSVEPLAPSGLRRVLKEFLESHADLSDRALLRVELERMLRRPALISGHSGWRAYPVTITAVLDRGQFTLELAFEVLYSSTCPASAALARQLIQERFSRDFGAARAPSYDEMLAWLGDESSICATPHGQRSAAQVRVRLAPSFADLPLVELIDRVEAALATPVQTAVKREDEQAFARLNGENLMFCEDAARRVQAALTADERVLDFHVRCAHFESLHPHDAVAIAVKGVAGGYSGTLAVAGGYSGNLS